jgi:RNA polymerase sigma-70 factor (ECF subfamily)
MPDELTAAEAIDELFRLYANDIYRYARLSLRSDSDAKDVVQDVFLKAFQYWGQFRHEASAKHWLFRIARSCVTDRIRRKMTEQTYLDTVKYQQPLESPSFSSLVELEHLIGQLKPDYRQVVVLRLIQDFTVAETAQILGWTHTKVRLTLHRAAKQLRTWVANAREPQPSCGFVEGKTREL